MNIVNNSVCYSLTFLFFHNVHTIHRLDWLRHPAAGQRLVVAGRLLGGTLRRVGGASGAPGKGQQHRRRRSQLGGDYRKVRSKDLVLNFPFCKPSILHTVERISFVVSKYDV